MRDIKYGDVVLVNGYLKCRVIAVYTQSNNKKCYDVVPIDRYGHNRIVPESSVKLLVSHK